ncbi:MAG: S-layer homology domain-containing protein [Clostridia bacterium]|nr:S-layer homology domain-containing protein [Clostridia bacterium]
MKKILTAVLAVMLVFSSFCFCTGASAANDKAEGLLFSFSYQDKNNGIVDRKGTATVEKMSLDGKNVLKVVPDKENAKGTNIALDCYCLTYSVNDIKDARYMTVEYKYECPADYENLGKMSITMFPNGGALKTSVAADSIGDIKNGEWATAIFNISKISSALNEDGTFKQFHLYPFSKGANPVNMVKEQVMYIGDVSFYSVNPDPNVTYTVSFRKGNPNAEGADPSPRTVKRGEYYTLPQHNYTLPKGEFLGWRYSVDEKLYPAGTEFTAIDNDVSFTAEFDVTEAQADYKTLQFTAYQNGSVDKKDNLSVTNDSFQGKEVVKIVPTPGGTADAKTMTVDGWSYAKAGIDLDVYKYVVISYYFDGTLPKEAGFRFNILPSGGILTKAFGAVTEPIKSGRWEFAVVDLTGIEANLTPDMTSHVARQIHLYVFNGLTGADMTGDETLYINSLIFFKEKPVLNVHESYMKGYDGGLFKPQGNMTRAEACTIVARLSAGSDELVPADKTTAFTDVPADQWYHKYISYVESLGYLKSYSGAFLPNQPITRAEFVELVYNMGLLKDAGKNGTFTDVAADHPKAEVIAAAGKAGLVNGYDNGNGTFSFKPDATITRAEVVTVINNAYGRTITADKLSEDMKYTFSDVAKDFWAYAGIMEATVPHVENAEGWISAVVSPLSIFGAGEAAIDYAAGEAYVKELDAISEKMKAEILATKTTVEIKGTKYYVSNNGNDSNDGKSPETAWKTIKKVNESKSKLKAGDAILFERGGLWRERLTGVTGITYSAYGEGDKPKLYGSPENGADPTKWSLLAGTSNIWVYANELIDVGGIICDGGKVVGLKEVPDLYDGEFFVRGTKKAKPFDIITELNENYEFFSDVRNASALATTKGKLYFKCDEGNPGELFSQIEFNIKGNVISNGNATDTHYDNLCIMYTGTHGIGSGTTKNLTVTNCEIGWIGGTIQTYSNNAVTRLGNGVEIYGGCDGYIVDNNYIYQCYDAGATHQYKGGTNDISMYNIVYSNNLIEDCIYSIEYFNSDPASGKALRDGKNFVIKDNVMRRAGYGWGNQRPDSNVSSHVKGWSSRNEYEKGTYIISDNIFDRCSWKMFQTTATYAAWCPIYRDNTYVQYIGGGFAEHKDLSITFDSFADAVIKNDLGDAGAKVYFLPESYKHDGFLTRG